jgi:Asp-tRNA(Asn)/Glu-tRNA(Gln) amidotransferase A subunit family amidase
VLSELTAVEAARRIASGELRATELAAALIARIAAREPEVQAFVYFDADYLMNQARDADLARELGRPLGPLHGVPIALKDIIDSADMPTEHGSPLFEGRRPTNDARVTALLREAGAIILGKTVTAELAVLHPGKTRNPHDPARTPGGSSSGSAAAVGAMMAPAALGTQTNGSVIRPASFCGVYGYKPTFGLVSRHGVLEEAPSLDCVGAFARSIEDLALIADCISAYDERDPAMRPRSRSQLSRVAMSEPPLPPIFGFVKSPVWDRARADSKEAFAELAEALGAQCEEVELSTQYQQAIEWHRVVMLGELARSYGPLYDRGGGMSNTLRGLIEEGRRFMAVDYLNARRGQDVFYGAFAELFERYDAIVTPAATGPAPLGLDATGDPIFSTLWSYMGVPCLSLPLLEVDGLPLGVQLVGPRLDDARLMRSARWLEARLKAQT